MNYEDNYKKVGKWVSIRGTVGYKWIIVMYGVIFL